MLVSKKKQNSVSDPRFPAMVAVDFERPIWTAIAAVIPHAKVWPSFLLHLKIIFIQNKRSSFQKYLSLISKFNFNNLYP